jgi:hypothetical protein
MESCSLLARRHRFDLILKELRRVMSYKGALYLVSCFLIVLCIAAVSISQRKLHRPINASDVLRVTVMGNKVAAGPIDPHQVVEWFNHGTDPRRSPDNVGHTTPTGAIILELKSGKRIGLWAEGTDFLVEQNGNYYYLRQPDLSALLDKLETWE